ncbi:MAG TPA: hypothetical protein VHR97_11930 [Candidatus Baltobacteraceae bacterium]|nr:hypothetical protein [Candidatus Baltobacteraceae bacterium]
MPRSNRSFYVERRPAGDYAARRGNSSRASFTGKTQGEAARRAHASDGGAIVFGERIRQRGNSTGKWRRLY